MIEAALKADCPSTPVGHSQIKIKIADRPLGCWWGQEDSESI